MDPFVWIALGSMVLAWVLYHLVAGQLLSLYIQARLSRAPIGMLHLFGMRIRKADVREVVCAHIRLTRSAPNRPELRIPIDALETHYLAGGNLAGVVTAMIAARGARVPLSWQEATSIDLRGVDPGSLVEAVTLARAAGYTLKWLDAAQIKKAGRDPAAMMRERMGVPDAPCPLCGVVVARPAAARP